MHSRKADDLRQQFPEIEQHIGSTLETLEKLPVHRLDEGDYDRSGVSRKSDDHFDYGRAFLFVDSQGELMRYSGPELGDAEVEQARTRVWASEQVWNHCWPNIQEVLYFLDFENLGYILECQVSHGNGQTWSVLSLPKHSSRGEFDARVDIKTRLKQEVELSISLITNISTLYENSSGELTVVDPFLIRLFFYLYGAKPDWVTGLKRPENIASLHLRFAEPQDRDRLLKYPETLRENPTVRQRLVTVSELYGYSSLLNNGQPVNLEYDDPLSRANWALWHLPAPSGQLPFGSWSIGQFGEGQSSGYGPRVINTKERGIGMVAFLAPKEKTLADVVLPGS